MARLQYAPTAAHIRLTRARVQDHVVVHEQPVGVSVWRTVGALAARRGRPGGTAACAATCLLTHPQLELIGALSVKCLEYERRTEAVLETTTPKEDRDILLAFLDDIRQVKTAALAMRTELERNSLCHLAMRTFQQTKPSDVDVPYVAGCVRVHHANRAFHTARTLRSASKSRACS
jgi:hypothetical protein